MLIRYALEVESAVHARAEYAIRLLLDGIGVAGRRVASVEEADLVYGSERPGEAAAHALWIRRAAIADWDQPTRGRPLGALLESHEIPLGAPTPDVAAQTADPAQPLTDVVFATYALVTGVLEQGMPRNAWGVPVGRGNVLAEAVWRQPLVPLYCAWLQTSLARRLGDLRAEPRWPGGRKYAVVVSHDVDAPFTRAPWSFYLRRLVRDVSQVEPKAVVRGVLQTLKVAALTHGARLRVPAEDPNFCFRGWEELEASVGTGSCFYVAVTNSGDPFAAAVDVNYDFRHPEIVNAMHKAIERGCEVGLHASINARRVDGRIAEERALLENVLNGHRVEGVRHHYWCLGRENPEETLNLDAEAGFLYDSSFGLSDTPGFRRGMIWPFSPFERQRGQEIPLLEVPPTLMDGAIFYRNVTSQEGRRQIEAHVDQVKSAGGAVVFDWHLEQLNPARLHGAGAVFAEVLGDLAGDSAAYWATPIEVARWWRERRERIARVT
jgi:hypothetical protein